MEQLIDFIERNEDDEFRAILKKNPDLLKLVDNDGWTLLHHASVLQNTKIINYLIDLGIDVNVQNNIGETALMTAASKKIGNVSDICEILLEANAYVHLCDNHGKSGMQLVCQYTVVSERVQTLCLENLLEYCSDDPDKVSQVIIQWKDSLFNFVWLGDPTLTRIILQKGYPVNTKYSSQNGITALHAAVRFNKLEQVKILVEFGADVNATDNNGRTPLWYYEESFRGSPETLNILKILLEQGALTTELIAEESKRMAAEYLLVRGGREEIRLLRQYNLDLRVRDGFGATALHILALNECENVLEELEGMDFDVNARDEYGQSPLNFAEHRISAIHWLLKNGADVNTRDNRDRTPLHYAFLSNHDHDHAAIGSPCICNSRRVELLLEYGADVNATGRMVSPPSSYFRESHRGCVETLKSLKMMLDRGAWTTPMKQNGWKMRIEALLQYGGKEEIQLILQYNLNLRARDSIGRNALHCLALNDCVDIFENLIGMDFDVNARDSQGRTTLHYAVHNSSSVMFLLKNDANVNALDDNNLTPLHVAFSLDNETYKVFSQYSFPTISHNYNIQSIEILLEYGADLQAISSYGTTVIDDSIRKKEFEAIEPVIARLAMLEVRGVAIKEQIQKQIENNDQLKKWFDSYVRKLEQVKNLVVWELITLYDLLMERENKLEIYMRNADLVMKLVSVSQKHVTRNHYYFDLIRRRMKKILSKVQLKSRAAIIMCELMKMHYQGNYIILDLIINYLHYEDLLTLVRLRDASQRKITLK